VQTKDGFLGRIVARYPSGEFDVKIPGLNETRKMAGSEVMEPVPLDDMSRILEQVGVLGFSDELQKRKDGKHSPAKIKTLTPQKSAIISPSPRKGANVSKSSASKEDFVDEDESDVESDDSLADIGSSEDEEMAEKRQNFKPPKLEPEGNEWRCAMCRVINDEGIPKCQSCDTKNPNAVKAAAATPAAASVIKFGFGGGASVGASGAAAIKFGVVSSAPVSSPVPAVPAGAAKPAGAIQFGFGNAQVNTNNEKDTGDGKGASPIKTPVKLAANVSKGSALKEDFVDEDESDVDSDDSLADIGSSEDEEMAEKRQNFKPPKLEPEGNEWRCAMCRVINDEGIPKCQSCDTKNPNAVKAAAATPAAASGIQFGFGGGASVGASGAAAIKFGFSPSSSTPKAGGASTSPSTVPPVCLAQCLVCMYCVFVCLHVSRACLHVLCVCVCPKHSWQVSSILLSMPFSLECHLMSS